MRIPRPCFINSLFGIILTVTPFQISSQNCPTYTHKTTIVGIRDSIPDGWFVFSQASQAGLFKCNTKSGSPAVIPNTTSDQIVDVDISDNGEWIMYVAKNSTNNKLYLIKPDGTKRTEIPLNIDNHAGWRTPFPPNAQFYHQAPYGNEIVYIAGLGRVRSAVFHVDSLGSAVFDSNRVLANFVTNDSSQNWFLMAEMVLYSQLSASRNALFCGLALPVPPDTVNASPNARTSFITIPDNGLGTASYYNIYKWLNDDYQAWFGCGLTMSWDASLCLANSNAIGDSSCVPTQKSDPTLDHKGFYVTRFMYDTMPAIERDQVIMDSAYGLSINWCPEPYRFGTYDEVGFTNWSFSNSNDWVIGDQEGSQSPIKGIWVVHIPTNTWILAYTSTSGSNVSMPVMYLPGLTNAKRDAAIMNSRTVMLSSRFMQLGNKCSRIKLDKQVYGCELYSLSGKLMWRYSRKQADRQIAVDVPRNLRSSSALIIKYQTVAR
jgi:hypothetical protein